MNDYVDDDYDNTFIFTLVVNAVGNMTMPVNNQSEIKL